jgi:hypothetical protein
LFAGFAAALVFVSSAASANGVARSRWPRVHIPDPVAAEAARNALDRAWTLLGDARCSQVLKDFTDAEGRPLAERLAALGVNVRTYLTMIVLVDDTRHAACVSGVLAFTVPGSRVVRVCSEALKQTSHQSQEYTAAAFIHELLHTLGLGENPPSSKEITRRVRARCSRE